MQQDVVDLRAFYRTQLGRTARRMVQTGIRRIWPDVRQQVVLGLGYATPYLPVFRGEAERVIGFMPAAQGVAAWPKEGRNCSALVEEAELPLPDMSVDRVLIVHGLEATEHLAAMMREVWRVLSSGGSVLAVVPNRRGIWARIERTPFGHGHPYTTRQITGMLRDNRFLPETEGHALFIPPTRWRVWLGAAPAWERVGQRWFPGLSGVLLIEATKQLYKALPAGRREGRRRPLLVPVGEPAAVRWARQPMTPVPAPQEDGRHG